MGENGRKYFREANGIFDLGDGGDFGDGGDDGLGTLGTLGTLSQDDVLRRDFIFLWTTEYYLWFIAFCSFFWLGTFFLLFLLLQGIPLRGWLFVFSVGRW